MKTKHFRNTILFLFTFGLFVSCTEPYIFKTNSLDEALVVEATITNEFKHQKIKISKTYRLEENKPTAVANAVVTITDNLNNTYAFIEQDGAYVSVNEFQAIPNTQYKLMITTENGQTYTSSNETLTTQNQIESIIPKVITKNNGDRGVQISVNNFDPLNTSKYYRYEYEETYKIIAPYWNPFIMFNDAPGEPIPIIAFAPRAYEAQTCYSTKYSKDIIITNTVDLNEDRVDDFPVHFISDQNYIISHRYSILLRQYVQSLAAHKYYTTLKELSGSESILSQNQPGFFYGNLKCIDNSQEKIIGYFEVSSVSSKRMYFNYADLFPAEKLPPYYSDCTGKEYNSIMTPYPGQGFILMQAIASKKYLYYRRIIALDLFVIVPNTCGDCTLFSSNIVPSFWQD